eukprot:TRINITY_DN537_c0_g1_i1.p1 TRINITY_DN537_c0_g1~~TRINITY_DN537_c0_g1_i1.p1  ORF type:complete len:408 (+),score=84.26 TRINITY_DN537_c0_g1_i1:48-1271(+)
MYGPGIIIDIGTSTTKLGESGNDVPSAIIPSVVGICYTNGNENFVGSGPKEVGVDNMDIENNNEDYTYYVGSNRLSIPNSNTDVVPVMERGIVSDWNALEKLLDHSLYDRIRVSPDDNPVLLAESVVSPPEHRSRLTELLFEKYNSIGVFFGKNPTLATYSVGRGTGLVLDIGGGVTVSSAVWDGYVLKKSIHTSELSGQVLSTMLYDVMSRKNITVQPRYTFKKELNNGEWSINRKTIDGITTSYNHYHVMNIIDDMKETVCSLKSTNSKTFELPDNTKVPIDSEIVNIPEQLFNTDHNETSTVTDLVMSSIVATDIGGRSDLLNNIIITGGSSLFPGLKERFKKDFKALSNSQSFSLVTSPDYDRSFSVWMGGSILTSIESFNRLWITKEEYEEFGAGTIERKCP